MAIKFSKNAPLLLDGAIGSYISSFGLSENDYNGALGLEKSQIRNNDILSLTNPAVLTRVHEDYLRAGADIVTACTFCSVYPMQAPHGAASLVRDMALNGARIAKEAAEKFSTPSHPRYAAGSVGPTDKPLSLLLISDEDADPDELIETLKDHYAEQISALVDGGVDLLLIETCFDPMNAQAAISAAREVFAEKGKALPIVVSASVGASGRILTGETPAQFFAKLPEVDAYSLNCGAPEELFPAAREFARGIGDMPFCFYPNAGQPDANGNYTLSPEDFADSVYDLVRELSPVMVGGCCGTTPAHIAALAAKLRG